MPEPLPPSTLSQSVNLSPPAPVARGTTAILGTLLLGSLLLASLGVGAILGVLIAQVWPRAQAPLPWSERVLRQASLTGAKLRQLPQGWQGSTPPDLSPGLSTAPSPALPPLSEQEQEQLEAELQSLARDLSNWQERLTDLEQRWGQSTGGSLEQRFLQLQERSRPSQSALLVPQSDGLASQTAVPGQPSSLALTRDRILLPSSLLFESGGDRLTTVGQQLLATVHPDLIRQGPVTLVVASHTDGAQTGVAARQLSFRQALAVQKYLAQQPLGPQTRWLVVGFGNTRPLGLVPSQAQNQRIEIGIVEH